MVPSPKSARPRARAQPPEERPLPMKPTDNLLAWDAFLLTCRTGSITRTAVLLDAELSKTSRLLSDLEAELGFPLFDKKRRPMVPTPEGAALLAKVEPFVVGLRETVTGVLDEHARHVIRFAAPAELAQEYFTDMLLRYSAEHPNITFTIIPAVSALDVRTAVVDVAVVSMPKNSEDLVVRPYNVSNGVLLASPEYLARWGEPKTPAELSGHVGLLQESLNERPTTELFRFGESSGPIAWRRVFVSHDQLTLKKMALEHQGIAVDISPVHLIDELASGRLVPILEGWHREPWRMCVVTRLEDEKRSPALRAFSAWLAEATAEKMREASERFWRALAQGRAADPRRPGHPRGEPVANEDDGMPG